jgi:hypothetical protein
VLQVQAFSVFLAGFGMLRRAERTAHYHGRYKGVAGEWYLYALAQNT